MIVLKVEVKHMKKTIKSLVITLVACLTLSAIPFSTFAAEPESASTPKNWNEIEYETINEITVTQSDAVGDTYAIQEALNQALGKDDSVLTQITIPAGTYTTDWCLYIYSNTRLILEDGAIIKRSYNWQGGEMLASGEGLIYNNANAVCGYDAIHNVFIDKLRL